MSENDSDMIYGLWDKPPIFELILLSLQRLCAIFGATILVPIVVNTTVGEPVTPLLANLCYLFQLL